MLPESWHQQTEWEAAIAYDAGFTAGIEYARRAMDAGIAEAIGQAPGSAKAVVNRLVKAMDREIHLRHIEETRGHDHPGGPVVFDAALDDRIGVAA
jgi:hypothetical protein